MGSGRFPGKVMQHIQGKSIIEILLQRLSRSTELDQIIVATSSDPVNIPLINHVKQLGFKCEVGSENNVLKRYLDVSTKYGVENIVRITGDCPLVDAKLVDSILIEYKSLNYDYVSNTLNSTFPDGLDVEVFNLTSLKTSYELDRSLYNLEHVTPFIKNSSLFTKKTIEHSEDLSNLRLTLDEFDDLLVLQNIFDFFSPRIDFSWLEVVELYNKRPKLFANNLYIKRDEGSKLTLDQKLWRRARKVIPGGNGLLSKRPEMFLPGRWPTYFTKSEGCNIWDLNHRKYIDFSLMGVGTNILGYSHPEVDEAVERAIKNGNLSTLNCVEELLLAEKLIEIHPWAKMVKFARTGGEANAIAIRIARAYGRSKKIAICGYHGWHDWYLSANLSDENNLNQHLLPDLKINGVPEELRSTVFPFAYNNFDELDDLVTLHDIGIIKMEVMRNIEPENNFLQKVRDLADQKGIVLIFDECTSGFRETYGGLHKKYNVQPDMAVFGKALGNGYAITAVIGKEELMKSADSTFMSSTFWTERIGPAAALKTLEIMERTKSWEVITDYGNRIRDKWTELSNTYALDLSFFGLPSLGGFVFNSKNQNKYKTLITQEMLKQGYLATNVVYVSTSHTAELINDYAEKLSPVFSIIRDCENNRDVTEFLEGPDAQLGFKRLN